MREPENIKFCRSDNGMIKIRLLKKYVPFLLQKKKWSFRMLSGLGGVVIGSEMSGGVRKVVISNCVFDGTDRGIRIKSTCGRGGVVEDIQVNSLVMRNIE